MSTSVRKLTPLKVQSVIDQYNALRADVMLMVQASIFHADATTAIDIDDAVVDGYGASSSALINACVTAYTSHIASVCSRSTGLGSHITADTTNTISAATATNVASAITRANQYKAKFNLHIASTSHAAADTVNTITASDASDEASLVTLVNQCKAKTNSHFGDSMASQAIVLVDA